MLEATFLYTAMAGGAVLVLQFILMFLGGDHHGADFAGAHADLGDGHGDGHGNGHYADGWWFFEMVSLRTLAAAAMFFGLVGLTARSYDASAKASLLFAGGAAFAAMYGVYWMFLQLFKLESSGHQEIANALGLPATVYLRIPARNEGAGKVHLTMQQRLVEYLAVTDETEPIPTGENVWVSDIVNGEMLRVVRDTPIGNHSRTRQSLDGATHDDPISGNFDDR